MKTIRITLYTVGDRKFSWEIKAENTMKVAQKYADIIDAGNAIIVPATDDVTCRHIFLPSAIDDLLIEEMAV